MEGGMITLAEKKVDRKRKILRLPLST